MKHVIFIGILLAQIGSHEIRIDTFDKHSNRTGYITIDPRTGRFDQFDTHGNRLGYGTSTNVNGKRTGGTLPDRYGQPPTSSSGERR
jgi:hypothetical protein